MSVELYNAYQEKITWTKEQESCLNYTGSKTLMVKGIAGAGKSLVIQALAKQLLAGYTADKKNKVAIFTFSNTLNSATKEFLKVNGEQEEYINVTTLMSHLTRVYKAIGGPNLKLCYGDTYLKIKQEAFQKFCSTDKPFFCRNKFSHIFNVINYALIRSHFFVADFLSIITDFNRWTNINGTTIRFYFSHNHFKESTLACTICS